MFSQADVLPNGRYVIRWAVLILLFFLFWRKKFVYFLFANHAMKIFRPFRQLLKGSKTTELKQPHPQDVLFVVPIFWRFTVEVILPDIANVIGESGIWANQNRWNIWNGYWVVLFSEVVPLCLRVRQSIANFWAEVGSRIYVLILCCLASCKEIQDSPHSNGYWDSGFLELYAGFQGPVA